ncbi:MAG: GNAT family N-acetyltransferase [Alphaproteobacteria bacterium]
MHVRDCETADMEAVTAIYANYVLNGTATFEEAPPTLNDMIARFEDVRAKGLPWLVVEANSNDGEIAGYAYASPYRMRSAYRYTLEDSIYVAPSHSRQGVGRALLLELLRRCEALGYRQMIAAIGDSANVASIGLHCALGFEHVGVYRSVGLKFERWLDVVLMQKSLGEGGKSVPATF